MLHQMCDSCKGPNLSITVLLGGIFVSAAATDTLRTSQEAHQLVGQVKRRTTKIRPKAVRGGIFGRFFELRQMPTRSSW